MTENERIVIDFCNAFSRMDADELVEYCAPDAVYYNIPMPLLRGRKEIVELLGGNSSTDRSEVEGLLRQILDELGAEYEFDSSVKRGLGYYTEDGFEARCPQLGAQKQIAGGGRYAEGVGWAIGIDRLLLALR